MKFWAWVVKVDVREGVMDETENVIDIYPLRTLLGPFGNKTLNTVLRRFQKGYNKLLKKRKKKKEKWQPQK